MRQSDLIVSADCQESADLAQPLRRTGVWERLRRSSRARTVGYTVMILQRDGLIPGLSPGVLVISEDTPRCLGACIDLASDWDRLDAFGLASGVLFNVTVVDDTTGTYARQVIYRGYAPPDYMDALNDKRMGKPPEYSTMGPQYGWDEWHKDPTATDSDGVPDRKHPGDNWYCPTCLQTFAAPEGAPPRMCPYCRYSGVRPIPPERGPHVRQRRRLCDDPEEVPGGEVRQGAVCGHARGLPRPVARLGV